MRIWHYDPDTGLLIGEGTAEPDPMNEDEWILPAFSTIQKPPAAKAGRGRVFAGGDWQEVPDHRGETWYRGREQVLVETLGNPSEDGLAQTREVLPLGEAKAVAVARVKAHARFLIESTGLSWMVEREVSGGAPIPQSVKDEVASIRATSDTAESVVSAMTDSAAIEALDVAAMFADEG